MAIEATRTRAPRGPLFLGNRMPQPARMSQARSTQSVLSHLLALAPESARASVQAAAPRGYLTPLKELTTVGGSFSARGARPLLSLHHNPELSHQAQAPASGGLVQGETSERAGAWRQAIVRTIGAPLAHLQAHPPAVLAPSRKPRRRDTPGRRSMSSRSQLLRPR